MPTSSESHRPSRRLRLRRAVTGVALAVVAAGAGGVAATLPPEQPASTGTDRAAAVLAAAEQQKTDDLGAAEVTRQVTRRVAGASRSATRAATVPVKREVLTRASRSGGQVAGREDLRSADPRSTARAMLPQFGFGSDQFSCLDALWEKESGWDPYADNATSSAYGIPQALPGSKMATAGADWADNPATQIRWGLGYIRDTYGSPCAAWGHSQANNWY